MQTDKLTTFFAPPEQASDADIQKTFRDLLESPVLSLMFDSVPCGMLVLNRERQIVFSNRTAQDIAGAKDVYATLGLRPGNALRCVHADKMPAGCGTSEFCTTCGAVKAILSGQGGRPEMQECRITRKPDGEALDLRVWTTPFTISRTPLVLFALMDISDEKRRKALERIFFHDILNTASGIKGFAELLRSADPAETGQYKDIIFSLSRMIVDEINSQRTLVAAENNELIIAPVDIRSLDMLKEIVELYKYHQVASGRNIRIEPESCDVVLKTDPALLQRIIGNMLKNALEACKPGETVTLGCARDGDRIEFRVHNPNEMPREVQLQVFNRSFSTKGKGRGLGTYSIKLLSERYLKGSASFTSGKTGTTFRVSYPITL